MSHEHRAPPAADDGRGTTEPEQHDPSANALQQQHGRLYRRMHANPVLALTTKVVVGVVGTLVLVAGFITLVTPGPAFVLIPLGLAILASEFAFARRWLRVARDKAEQAKRRAEEMDPAVRRRRLLLMAAAAVVVVGAVSGYVYAYDWPGVAVDGWNWVQSIAGWVPDLPRM